MSQQRAMTISPTQAISVEFACAGVSFIFVCLRLYVRVHTRFSAITINPWYQDILILVAWLCSLGNAVVDIFANRSGMWNPNIRFTIEDSNPPIEKYITDQNELVKELKILYATQPVYFIAMFCVKMSFLLMYRHLFPPNMRKLRNVMHLTTALIVVGYSLIIGLNMLWCMPINRNWATTRESRCLAWAIPGPYFFALGFNIITDLLIYSLPFFLLPTLYRTSTRRQFIGVIVCFSLGLFCIICTTCRIFSVGAGAELPYVATWFAAEMASAIIAACGPPLRWFWISELHRRRGSGGSKDSPARRRCSSSEKATWTLGLTSKLKKITRTTGGILTGTRVSTRTTSAKDTVVDYTIDSAAVSGNRSGMFGASVVSNESVVPKGLAPRAATNLRNEKYLMKQEEEVQGVFLMEQVIDPLEQQPESSSMAGRSNTPVAIERNSSVMMKKKSMWRKWKKVRQEQLAQKAQKKEELGNLTFGGVNQAGMRTILEKEEQRHTRTVSMANGGRKDSPAGFGFLHGESFVKDNDSTTLRTVSSLGDEREKDSLPTRKPSCASSILAPTVSKPEPARAKKSPNGFGFLDSHTFFGGSESGANGSETSLGSTTSDYAGDEEDQRKNTHRISFISDAFGPSGSR